MNIVGRLKDLIIRGGENISPREVEVVFTLLALTSHDPLCIHFLGICPFSVLEQILCSRNSYISTPLFKMSRS